MHTLNNNLIVNGYKAIRAILIYNEKRVCALSKRDLNYSVNVYKSSGK